MMSISIPQSRGSFYLRLLVAFHILIIIASNYLVQLPIELFWLSQHLGRLQLPLYFPGN